MRPSRPEAGPSGYELRLTGNTGAFRGHASGVVAITTDVEGEEHLEIRFSGMVRDVNTPGWWHREGDILPSWFQSYLGLEASASLIRTYEIQFIPGLLQTPEYARSVIILGNRSAPTWEIDRRVGLRMRRQGLLTRDKPAQKGWGGIDEAAFRRPIGGSSGMGAQIAHPDSLGIDIAGDAPGQMTMQES